jgi:hypothetical protein
VWHERHAAKACAPAEGALSCAGNRTAVPAATMASATGIIRSMTFIIDLSRRLSALIALT